MTSLRTTMPAQQTYAQETQVPGCPQTPHVTRATSVKVEAMPRRIFENRRRLWGPRPMGRLRLLTCWSPHWAAINENVHKLHFQLKWTCF